MYASSPNSHSNPHWLSTSVQSGVALLPLPLAVQTGEREEQMPPFWHGDDAHSSTSTQCWPLQEQVPERQVQRRSRYSAA